MAIVPLCIKAAFAQANAIWPNRNKASDGSIGDPAHANRPSDHNPDARGIVHAFDLTHDPVKGPDCGVLAEHLRQRHYDGRETRVKYIIFARRIWNPALDRNWRAYKGANPHDKHMHVSILANVRVEADVSPWWVSGVPPVVDHPPTVHRYTLGGKPMASFALRVPLDGAGEGSAPIGPIAKLVAVSNHAPHDKYNGDGDTLVFTCGYRDHGGTAYAVVKGGPAGGEVYPWVTVAD